ncbi:hypothetical protein TTHERM_00569120 (macronuclear) [Tetrahymena thermophila SB210]|uniref:Uncharacterized protein n=1 Tax=Tetrahymena thermophila (strain SB210) TaxID=312017 RepID=Q24I62_TETTS|nr:hypothetical protein TTHERM_00569120 [Tetrahymena thermophila SB210]EAS07376.1 hypothetical protein TTHERM_00569120 [Tetrahymena thermophila SB210]|eukprot:XP_001027618.1 hypothetical protein TTHERM_00569120 [Tetrahymena thermophila SB210]
MANIYQQENMLTTKNLLIDDNLQYNDSSYYSQLGTLTSTQTNDHSYLKNSDTSECSTKKLLVDKQDENKNEMNDQYLKILAIPDIFSFQNDDSFEEQFKAYQEDQLLQKKETNIFTDNNNYNQYQQIHESPLFDEEESIKFQKNEQFQMNQYTYQAQQFENNSFYPQCANQQYQVKQQKYSNYFDNYIYTENDFEEQEGLFNQESSQQQNYSQFEIYQQMNQKMFNNNNFIPINFTQTQEQTVTLQPLINGQNTRNNCQIEQIKPIQLNQLEDNQQQLEQQQEIQNDLQKFDVSIENKTIVSIENKTIVSIENKTIKKRNRKRKQNLVGEDQCQETKNIANNIFIFLFEQIKEYGYEIKQTQKGYISISNFNKILTEELKKQPDLKKILLDIVNSSLIKKATNTNNYKTMFKVIKYKAGLEVMIQNPGKFRSIKEATNYAFQKQQK